MAEAALGHYTLADELAESALRGLGEIGDNMEVARALVFQVGMDARIRRAVEGIGAR